MISMIEYYNNVEDLLRLKYDCFTYTYVHPELHYPTDYYKIAHKEAVILGARHIVPHYIFFIYHNSICSSELAGLMQPLTRSDSFVLNPLFIHNLHQSLYLTLLSQTVNHLEDLPVKFFLKSSP